MRVLGPAVLSLLLVSPLAGDTVTLVPMAPATLDELARTPDAVAHTLRVREHRPAPFAPLPSAAPPAAPVTIAAATPAPPPKATLGFRVLARPNIYPADASGAVSARFVVDISNDGITVFDRSGNQLAYTGLGQFWTDGVLPKGAVYDPRIVYDAANNKWVVTTLWYDLNGSNGRFLLALSNDPTGTWSRYSFKLDTNGAIVGDLPRIGQTADNVLVTFSEWVGDFPAGSAIISVNKPYASPPSVDLFHSTGGADIAPVTSTDHTHKAATADPGIIAGGVPGVGIYDYIGAPNVFAVSKAYISTPGMYQHGWGLQLGPQSGSTQLMDCGDTMIQNGVLRNGAIWLVQSVLRTNYRTGILVWRISGGTATTFLIEDSESVYAFPSIAVNRFGAALVAYSVFTSQTYPSVGYSYIDPAGTLSAPAILKSGDTAYAIDRWGDYTTTLVDPVDDTSFWTVQIYPVQQNSWALWWSYIPVTGFAKGRAARH